MADYTPTQVAELLGVTADTVRRWCDEGRLAATRSEGGQRTIDGTRQPPSQLVFFSPKKGDEAASGQVFICGPLSVE